MSAHLKSLASSKYLYLILIIAVMLCAAVMHLYLIGTYPPGLDSDAGTDGLDSLKLTRYGIVLFYIVINANTDPLFIYTATATSWLFGSNVLALRLPAVFYSLLSFAMTYTALAELARGEFDSGTRRRIAVLAVAALATSQAIAFFNRMGLRFSTQDVIQMAAVWALARAIRYTKFKKPATRYWLIAGALASLTQYTYPAARVLPLLFGLIFLIKAPSGWWKDKTIWHGLALYALGAFIVIVPQLIWYSYYPETLLGRAGQTGLRNNPLYDQLGLWGTLLDKFKKYHEILYGSWLGQYNQIKEPLFAPLFYYGFLGGLLVLAFRIRKRFSWVIVTGVAVMLLPDIIAGEREFPHELRLTGAYPFVAAVVGLGFGDAIGWLKRWRPLQVAASLLLIGAVVWTMGAQADKFFRDENGNWGKMKWGGNTWLRRIAAGNGEFIANSDEAILLPLNNYAHTTLKYLVSNRAQVSRSAIDENGKLIVNADQVKILLPRGDDNELWQGDATQWVLFKGDTVYMLPPTADVTPYLPPQTDATSIYGKGIDEFMRLGHVGMLDWNRLQLATSYKPQFPLHTCFKNSVCLIGASYSRPTLHPNDTLRVQLFWTSNGTARDEHLMFVDLLDREQKVVAHQDAYPLQRGYHTYEWRRGETIITTTDFKLPPTLAAGQYGIQVGFYLSYDVRRVPTDNSDDRAYFVQLKSPRPTVTLPANYTPAEITLADEVKLIGYRIDSLPTANQPLKLTVWWRGYRHATYDWTSFFHITPVNEPDKLIAQADRTAGDVTYPATAWDENEIVEDHIEINGKFDAGDYTVWVGLYSPITQERATVSPEAKDNRPLLTKIHIVP